MRCPSAATTSSWSAPDRPAWRRRCTRRPRASARLTVDMIAVGGQAATSSRIENYLGFPTGISGQDLATRAAIQAQKFGAVITSPCAVASLCEMSGHLVAVLSDGTQVAGRALVAATGAHYRKLPVADLDRYEMAGVYYAATELEARMVHRRPDRRRRRRQLGRPGGDVPRREGLVGVRRRAPPAGSRRCRSTSSTASPPTPRSRSTRAWRSPRWPASRRSSGSPSAAMASELEVVLHGAVLVHRRRAEQRVARRRRRRRPRLRAHRPRPRARRPRRGVGGDEPPSAARTRRADRASSPSATCVPGRPSGWRRRSARGRRRSARSTSTSPGPRAED